MQTIVTVSTFIILMLTAICIYSIIKSRTLFDRTIGVSLIGNNAVLLIILAGVTFERVDMFIDIAVAYALLNFIIAIVLGKYIDRRGTSS